MVYSIIKAVMSSTTEVKTGALYINTGKGIEICNFMEELGHKHTAKTLSIVTSAVMLKSHGDALSLVRRLQCQPKAIPFLLETRYS